jgi:hypothetical protein
LDRETDLLADRHVDQLNHCLGAGGLIDVIRPTGTEAFTLEKTRSR